MPERATLLFQKGSRKRFDWHPTWQKTIAPVHLRANDAVAARSFFDASNICAPRTSSKKEGQDCPSSPRDSLADVLVNQACADLAACDRAAEESQTGVGTD
jgi:hypothetical protein